MGRRNKKETRRKMISSMDPKDLVHYYLRNPEQRKERNHNTVYGDYFLCKV